eukprot:scpid98683/ scgid14375/ 
MLLQLFINGQATKDLRLALASPRPASLDAAVRKAIEVGAIHAREQSRSGYAQPVFATAPQHQQQSTPAPSRPRHSEYSPIRPSVATENQNGDQERTERDRLAGIL